MNTFKMVAITTIALSLSACASLPVVDNELSNTVDFQSQWQINGQQPSPVENGWLADLDNSDLSEFVSQVLNNNPNYNEIALRMQAAGFNADALRGRLYPRLGVSANAGRTRISTPTNNSSDSLSIGFDANWEIDVWGKLSSNAAAARSNYEGAQYDYQGARLSLAAQVAQSWFDVIEAKQQLDLSRRTVNNYQRTTDIIENRYKRGLSNGLDLRLSISNLEAAKASEKFSETAHRQTLRRLELLAGRYPSAQIKISGDLPNKLKDIPIGVPLDILERRPDIQSAKSKLYAAGYRAQAAEKAMLPSFSITARGSNTSEEFAKLLKFDNVFWNLIGGITQPIFQGGQLKYTAKAEQLNFEAQKQNFAQKLLLAFKEVEDALDNDRSLAQRVIHTEQSVINAIAAEKVALEQYSQGLIRISTLLQSQRQSLTQQSQLLSIKKQRINNRISLYLSLGGDFSANNTNLNNIKNQGSDQKPSDTTEIKS